MSCNHDFSIHSTAHGFSIISNGIFRNNQLSLKAKGLLCTMLSLPDTWDYSIAGLLAIINPRDDGGKVRPLHGQSKDALYTILTELEDKGYLLREQPRLQNGQMGKTIYHIFDAPQQHIQLNPTSTLQKSSSRPVRDFPDTVKPDTTNPAQLNTKRINNLINQSSSSSTAAKKEAIGNRKNQQHVEMKSDDGEAYKRLCRLSIKPVRADAQQKTQIAFVHCLEDGYSAESVIEAYKHYKEAYRRQNAEPRYAKQLVNWLEGQDGLRFFAPKNHDHKEDSPELLASKAELFAEVNDTAIRHWWFAKVPGKGMVCISEAFVEDHTKEQAREMLKQQLSEEVAHV